MKHKPAVTTLYPDNRLGALIARPGGMDRASAIRSGRQVLETARQPVRDEIDGLIQNLEAAAARAIVMADIAGLADRIVSLALLVEMDALARAAMQLCDLGLALGETVRADPVAVHVKALRLLAPGAPVLAAEEAETVLAGLAGLVRHVSSAA